MSPRRLSAHLYRCPWRPRLRLDCRQAYGAPTWVQRRVIFWQKPGRSYRLLYGQSQAKAPQYEMARLTDRKTIESALPSRLGTEEVNTAYADPRPWTERHPGVIWVALGIAVALLGLSALQAMRR